LRHISVGPGGARHAAMEWYLAQWGITVKEVVGSTPSQYVSLGAGDADISALPVDGARPHWEAGKLTVLMVSGSNLSPPPWQSVPNAAAVGLKNDPALTTRS